MIAGEYYPLRIFGRDADKATDVILALENRRGMVQPERLAGTYYELTEEARRFASEKRLGLDIPLLLNTPPAAVRDVADYIFADGSPNTQRLRRHLKWLVERHSIPVFAIRIRTYDPKELVGREKVLEAIHNAVMKGKHVSLRAPRTMGKTAILHALKENPPASFSPAFMLARGVASPCSFVGRLSYALKEGQVAPSEAQRAAEETEARAENVGWEPTMRSLLSGCLDTLVLVDEFADFLRELHGVDGLNAFLADFQKILSDFQRVRFVFASSDSEDRMFGPLAEGFGKLVESIPVPPLDPPDAEMLLEELVYCAGMTPARGQIAGALDLIGQFVPYFVHAFAAAWQEAVRRKTPSLTVNSIYNDELLGLTGWNLFREMLELYKKYPPPRPRGARAILAALARADTGMEKSYLRDQYEVVTGSTEFFEDTLDRLTEDMLIRPEGNTFGFYSKILKDLWRRYPQH